MQNPEIQTRKQTERRDIAVQAPQYRRRAGSFLFVVLMACIIIAAGTSSWAQRADKKPKKPVAQKESAINDATVQDYLKKTEEQMKKGEFEGSLPTLIRINDYSEDVLKTVKLFRTHYEKVISDSSVSQGEREDLVIKLNRMNQLIPKYTSIREMSSYDLGYMYAKKGDSDRARKYLLKVFETTPFSTKSDSPWMKSKKLLLALYGLEGEF